MLKSGAQFVRMEDAGLFRLPPQAKIVHRGMPDELNQGDYVKFCVDGLNNTREKFWAIFQSYNQKTEQLTVTVDNDMVYSDFHGIYCDDVLVIPTMYLCASMKIRR